MSADEKDAISRRIIEHAEAHYDDGGWDVVVECYDAATVTYLVWDVEPGVPVTFEDALRVMTEIVSVYADREADAENSAF